MEMKIYPDVKAPNGNFFNTGQVGDSIQKQLRNVPDAKVILDTSYMNSSQLSDLRSWMSSNLSSSDLSRIVEVNSNLLP